MQIGVGIHIVVLLSKSYILKKLNGTLYTKFYQIDVNNLKIKVCKNVVKEVVETSEGAESFIN